MCNDELTQKDKVILNGRVYPAIQACVSNRYKIVLGIFAYYSFIYTSENFYTRLKCCDVNLYVSTIFALFVLHNLVNYWCNNNTECELEKRKRKWPWMEIFFAIFTWILIAAGYFTLN